MPENPANRLDIEQLLKILAKSDPSSQFHKTISGFLDPRLLALRSGSAGASPEGDEAVNPFSFFDAIYCINRDSEAARWEHAAGQFALLGIARRVLRFSTIDTPHAPYLGCVLSHRTIVANARRAGLRNVLVFEDDVVFTNVALGSLRDTIDELRSYKWRTLYLGADSEGETRRRVPGCNFLQTADDICCSFAVAYHRSVFDRILDEIPENPAEAAIWLQQWERLDRYHLHAARFEGQHFTARPVVAAKRSQIAAGQHSFIRDIPTAEAAERHARGMLSTLSSRGPARRESGIETEVAAPPVQFLIPAWNDLLSLVLCLPPILRIADQVVIHDDGSTDGSSEYLDNMSRSLPPGKLKVLRNDQHRGWSVAREMLLPFADPGMVRVWADADDLFVEECWPRLIHELQLYRRLRFRFYEVWGDHRHTTMAGLYSDACHIAVWPGTTGPSDWRRDWYGHSVPIYDDGNLPYEGPFVGFHMSGYKPDSRLAAKGGPLRTFNRNRDARSEPAALAPSAVHAVAMSTLFGSELRFPAPMPLALTEYLENHIPPALRYTLTPDDRIGDERVSAELARLCRTRGAVLPPATTEARDGLAWYPVLGPRDRSPFVEESAKAWMTGRDADLYEALLHKLAKLRNGKLLRVVEWGMGRSTFAYTSLLESIGAPYTWLAIEYNRQFFESMRASAGGRPNISFCYAEEGLDRLREQVRQPGIVAVCYDAGELLPDVAGRQADWRADLDAYVSLPADLGFECGLAVVDGRKRRRCVIQSATILDSGGYVLLHDAWRARYQCALKTFRSGRRIGDEWWIGSQRDTDFADVLPPHAFI